MKTLDITHFYSEKSGGIRTYIDNKIDYFAERPYIEHIVIIPGKHDDLTYIKNSKIYKIKSPHIFVWNQYRFLINRFKISNIIEYEKPDIIEVGSMFLIPGIIKRLKEKMSFKTIGFFHSNLENTILAFTKKQDSKILSNTTRSYILKAYKDMDLVIAPSLFAKRYLNSIGIFHVEVVYHGINTDLFNLDIPKEYLRDMFNLPKDKVILTYVGRFSKDKNFLELLEIFSTIDNLHPNTFHLLLVGDGPDKKHIDKLNNYTLLGYIRDKKVLAKIYHLSDIFISTSKTDTFGYALVEAQACGLPVIAYNTTSFPEIVFHNEFLANTKEEFIKNIVYLSKNLKYIDKKSIKTFVKKNFYVKTNMAKLESIYENLSSLLVNTF